MSSSVAAEVTRRALPAVPTGKSSNQVLFNQFAQQARAACAKIKNPWTLYYRVTITDAIELGLLDTAWVRIFVSVFVLPIAPAAANLLPL